MNDPVVSGATTMAGFRAATLWLGPLLAALAAASILGSGLERDAGIVTFIAVLCVVWWVFEPVPIPVTSLLPLALLPLLGVLTPAEVGQAYGSPLILLLLGGFLLSLNNLLACKALEVQEIATCFN